MPDLSAETVKSEDDEAMTSNHDRADHDRADHDVSGSPHEQMRRILARHLCGWISGHGAPVDHFLGDADLIMREAHEHGIRFYLVSPGTANASDGFTDIRVLSQSKP